MGAPQYEQAGADIGGTGTTNTIPMWTAGSTLGNSAISQVAGAIQTLTLTNAGAGATNGTYSQQALTGGTGTGATADIVVAVNVVTVLALRSPGTGYTAGDTLSCATIGGGGFVFTVSAVSASDNASGNVTATRIGAGTTNPIAGVDSRSAMAVLGTSQFIATNPSFPSSPLNVQAAAYIGTTADPSGRCTPPLGTTIALGYFGNPIFNMSSQTSFCQATGAFFKSSLEIAGNGSSTRVLGVSTDARVFGSTISGKSLSIFAFSAQANISADLSNANNFSLITSYSSSQSVQSTTAQTITTIASFNDNSTFFSGGAHVVTNHYAFRSVAPTLGSATITNRWGISLEDAAANNLLAGATIIGAAAGTTPAAGSKLDVRGVIDLTAASTNGVKFNNRGGAGISSTTQTSYEEGSYTPTLSAGWTATAGNYTGYWTRNGRLVTLTIQFTGGTNSGATGGSTISTPTGLTPARNGAGTAVNNGGTALGNGVVVVTTAGTIINANAITTTTIDKTIVVQYEV